VPFAVSWRGQRAGNRDYCGQNKEQPRKDTIAIPPICQGPARSYLLDLTPSHQCLHPSCPESCLAKEQPGGRWGLMQEEDQGKQSHGIEHGRFSALGQELPCIRQAARVPEHHY